MSSVALKRQTDSEEVTVMLDEDGTVERLERLPSGTLLTDDWTIDPAEAARIVSELSERPPPGADPTSRWGFDAPDDGRPPNFRAVHGPETSGTTAFVDLAALLEIPEPEPAFPDDEPDPRPAGYYQESAIVAGFLIGATTVLVLVPSLQLTHYSEQFRDHFDNQFLQWFTADLPFVLAFAPLFAIAGLLTGMYATVEPMRVARNGGYLSLFIVAWNGALVAWNGALFPSAAFVVLPYVAKVFAWLGMRRREELTWPEEREDLAEPEESDVGSDLP